MQSLHHDAFVFDAHCDTLGQALPGLLRRDLREWGAFGHLDLPRLAAGGINCQVFACFPGESRLNAGATSAALARLEVLCELLAQAPESITLVQTAADLDHLTPDGPIGALLGLEGAEALDGTLSLLHTFFRLGVRVLGLAWNPRNAACDGVDGGSDFGLTAYGRELVHRCNQLGVVLDVSHLNAAGTKDVLSISRQPIIASHSNARALCNNRRNLTDSQLAAIAAKGGVIGATFVPDFLTDNQEEASIAHLLAHIDYMVDVAGIDHVGLGSDFDGWSLPEDLDSGEKYPRITDGLLAYGYPEEAIRKILGENFRRVFHQVLPPGDPIGDA